MSTTKDKPDDSRNLREQAEKRAKQQIVEFRKQQGKDTTELIHELRVHQIELEIQNEELRNAQLELAESRNRYCELYDFAPVGYFTLNKEGLIVGANLTGTAFLGEERDNLLKSKFSHFITPDSQDEFYLHHKQVVESGTRQSCEVKLRRKDGTEFFAQLVSVAVAKQNGKYDQFRTTITDITEQKKAEESLQESEERYRSLFENMLEGSAYCKMTFKNNIPYDFVYIAVNSAFGKLTGLKNVAGKKVTEVIPGIKESNPELFEIYGRVALTGQSEKFETYLSPLGIWLSISVYSPAREHFVATFENITERKRAEQALQTSETRFRELFDNMSSGVAIYEAVDDGSDFIIRNFNAAGQKMDKTSKEDAVGKRVTQVFPGIKTMGLLDVFRRVWKTGRTERHPTTLYKDNRISGWRENYVYKLPSGEIVAAYDDVTDRQTAQEKLREERNLLRTLIDHIPDKVYVKGRDSRFIVCNKTTIESNGVKKEEELIGKTDFDLYEKPLAQQFFDDEQELMRTGQPMLNREIWAPDDSSCCMLVTKVPLRDQLGNIIGMVGINRDISGHKATEHSLRKSEDRFKQVAKCAGEWIWEVNTEGLYTYSNSIVQNLLGFKSEEIVGKKHFYDFFAPDVKESLKNAAFETFSRKENFVNFVNPVIHKNGSTIILETTGMPILDEKGNLIGYRGADRNVTERNLAEEKLQTERNLLRTLIDHIPGGIYVKDKNSRFLAYNKSLVEYWQLRGKYSVIGKTDFDLFEPEQAQHYFDEEQKVIQTGKPIINQEVQCTDKSGNANFLLVTKVPLRDSAGNITGLVGIHRDITERKKNEEDLKRLNRVLETITDTNQFAFMIQDRDELMRKVCETIVKHAYKMAWIGFCDEENKRIVPQAHAGFEENCLASVKITYDDSEYEMGPSRMAVKTAKPSIMRFITTDPQYEPWRTEAIKRGYRSSASIPIFGKDTVIGVMNIYADKEDAFEQEEIKLLEELSHDIATGIRSIDERARRQQAEQALLEYHKLLRRLASKLTLAEESERRHIAGEIHDEIGQTLAMAKIKLDTLRNSPPSETSAAAIEEISTSVDKVIQETRTLTFELSNPILYELGFETAVAEWLEQQVQVKHGISTEFFDDGLSKPISDDVKAVLFRNTRELLINCIKHAKAGKVRVGIHRIDDSIEIVVEDNGIGFDPAEVRLTAGKRATFGLFSVRESLEDLGGHFTIESKPGAGCKAVMTAPLKKEV